MNEAAATNHRIIVGISAFAALALLPFTVRHVSNGDWYPAGVIGTLNLVLAIGALWLHRNRHRPRSVRYSGIALVFFANLVALLSIHALGGATAYWIFPIIFANFYLLPFKAGAALSVAFSGLALTVVASSVPPAYLMRLLVTTPLCLFFGVIFSCSMARQRKQLQYLASHDALTGAGNRHGLDKALQDAVARRNRYRERCSLIIFDIDAFKAINDSMGHMHADDVIAGLAQMVSERIRAVDRLYRFGGEEFVLMVPHAGARSSWQLAEALRMEVEEHAFAQGTAITISGGVAELKEGETAEDWLRRADDALIRAKNAGRNRIVSASIPVERINPTGKAETADTLPLSGLGAPPPSATNPAADG